MLSLWSFPVLLGEIELDALSLKHTRLTILSFFNVKVKALLHYAATSRTVAVVVQE